MPATNVVDCQDTYLDVIDIWMTLKISEALIWIHYTMISVLIHLLLCVPPCHVVFKDIFWLKLGCDAPVNQTGDAHVMFIMSIPHRLVLVAGMFYLGNFMYIIW